VDLEEDVNCLQVEGSLRGEEWKQVPQVSVVMFFMENCDATLRTRVASHGAIQQYQNSHNHNNTKLPTLYATVKDANGTMIT